MMPSIDGVAAFLDVPYFYEERLPDPNMLKTYFLHDNNEDADEFELERRELGTSMLYFEKSKPQDVKKKSKWRYLVAGLVVIHHEELIPT